MAPNFATSQKRMTVDDMIAVFNNEWHYSQIFLENSPIKQEKKWESSISNNCVRYFCQTTSTTKWLFNIRIQYTKLLKIHAFAQSFLEFRQLILKNFCIHNTHTYNLSNRAENHEQKLQNGRLYQRTLGHSQHLGVEPNEAPPAALSTPCGNNLTLLNLFFSS